MRRLAALEERRQEALRQEAERQRLAELQRLQREAEEKLRREELLEKRLESIRRQEEEKEKRAAAMQQEELRRKETEQQSQSQQQDFLPSECDEVSRNEHLKQVAEDQEHQDGRNSEEVPQQQAMQTNEEALQQSREHLPEDAAGLAGPCAQEEHCNQEELDMKREKVEDLDSQEERMCKTQVLEQEPSSRQSQEEELRTVATNLAELEGQDHGKEPPLQDACACHCFQT